MGTPDLCAILVHEVQRGLVREGELLQAIPIEVGGGDGPAILGVRDCPELGAVVVAERQVGGAVDEHLALGIGVGVDGLGMDLPASVPAGKEEVAVAVVDPFVQENLLDSVPIEIRGHRCEHEILGEGRSPSLQLRDGDASGTVEYLRARQYLDVPIAFQVGD